MVARLTIACVVMLSIGDAHADEARVVNDDSARTTARVKLGRRLEIAGTAIWGAAYLVNAGIAIAQVSAPCGLEVQNQCGNKAGYASGLAPIVGPWIQVGYSHDDATTIAVYSVPGAIQIVGVALLVAGVVIRQRAEKKSPHLSALPAGNGLSLTLGF